MMDSGYGHGFGSLWTTLIIVVIIAGILMLMRGKSNKSNSPPSSSQNSPPQTPLQILEQRYARGELDREEYLQKKNDLEHKNSV